MKVSTCTINDTNTANNIIVSMLRRGARMKFYNKEFLKSELFYTEFYLPFISLMEYIIKENYDRELGDPVVATDIINQEFITHCENYFKDDILFYNELSKYILNEDGTFKNLNEYIFFKLRYYGTKFLDIANENRNFFEEERVKFIKNNYNKAIIMLSQLCFHDAKAVFDYKDGILHIIYRRGCYEKIFEFYGIEDWEQKEFMEMNPILIIEELYEEVEGTFIYNTLWCHKYLDGNNYSELSIKFTNLVQIK